MKGMQLPPELFKERAEKRVKLGLILLIWWRSMT